MECKTTVLALVSHSIMCPQMDLEGVSRDEKAITLGTGTSTVRIVDDAMFEEIGEVCKTLCATLFFAGNGQQSVLPVLMQVKGALSNELPFARAAGKASEALRKDLQLRFPSSILRIHRM